MSIERRGAASAAAAWRQEAAVAQPGATQSAFTETIPLSHVFADLQFFYISQCREIFGALLVQF
jgi:hypothetical protein